MGLAMSVVIAGTVLAVLNFKAPFVCGQSYTGTTYDGHPYGAIDFNQAGDSDYGDPVLASASGTVVQVYPPNGQVRIDHADGSQTRQTVYAHMANISVSTGNPVQLGQQIGTISDVGQATGHHLHYQQLLNGVEQLAKFDGVTYVYNTLLTSTNCGSSPGAPALLYRLGTTARIYRWTSSGSAFTGPTTTDKTAFDLNNVGDRMVSGDFSGDGNDDIAVAFQNANGTFSYHVWTSSPGGFTYAGVWYTSGQFNLAWVAGRLAAGDFNGDGRADVAMLYDLGGGLTKIYRWLSTGSTFGSLATSSSIARSAASIGDRFAAGDFDGDGASDVVIAQHNANGTFNYRVWTSATTNAGSWYTSGPFDLYYVQGRMVLGHWAP